MPAYAKEPPLGAALFTDMPQIGSMAVSVAAAGAATVAGGAGLSSRGEPEGGVGPGWLSGGDMALSYTRSQAWASRMHGPAKNRPEAPPCF